ncbi:MAG: hypothetical protein RLZZ21_1226 [Planctomycetota bacterium]|jgi:hypothetical protein
MSTASFSRPHSANGSSFGKWAAVLGGLALLAFLVAWLLGWIRFTTDPRVLEIRAMQEEARQKMTASGGPKTVAEATAAMASMGQIRDKIEALPPNLRQQVERSGGSMFREAFRARMDEYFTAPPQQRLAVLDRQIDQEEMMRKAFEAGRGAMAALGGGGGGSNAGGGRAAAPASGGNATRGPRGSRTEEDRNKWRKSMIDRTTPEQRARYVEYRRAMEERREKRGLPAGPGR